MARLGGDSRLTVYKYRFFLLESVLNIVTKRFAETQILSKVTAANGETRQKERFNDTSSVTFLTSHGILVKFYWEKFSFEVADLKIMGF